MKISLSNLMSISCCTCCTCWFIVSIALAIGLGVPLANLRNDDGRDCQLHLSANPQHMTEDEFRSFVSSTAGWIPTFPNTKTCLCADSSLFPAYVAPTDICALYGLPNSSQYDYCSNARIDHVLTCISRTTQLPTLVASGKCLQTVDGVVTSINTAANGALVCEEKEFTNEVNYA